MKVYAKIAVGVMPWHEKICDRAQLQQNLIFNFLFLLFFYVKFSLFQTLQVVIFKIKLLLWLLGLVERQTILQL